MKIDITPALIHSYFNGTCTAWEKKEVENWLKSSEENFTLAMCWLKKEASDKDEELLASLLSSEDEVYRRTLHSIEENSGLQMPGSTGNMGLARGFWYVAAASMAVIILGTWLMKGYISKERTTIATAFGETRHLVLPDSSLVILNSNSSLTFVSSQFSRDRQVQMQGEAFFDVKHTDDNRPFQVHLSGDKVVEVLGTEFNVSERKELSEITLKSGRIRLDMLHDKKRFDLAPGQMVKVNHLTGSAVKSTVNAELHYAWINGKWKFDNTSLMEIVARIEATRGVKVNVYEPSLNKRTISGTIPLDGDAMTLVTNVADAFDLVVEHRDGAFHLKEKK